MSETEYHKGKLVPIQQFDTLEATAKFHLEVLGFTEKDIGDYTSSWLDFALHNTDVAHVYNGELYRIDDTQRDPSEGFSSATLNADGTIGYEMQYYNGGSSFNEVLDSALEDMNAKQNRTTIC